MKVSTKGRYALRMLLDLAEHNNSGYVSLKEIAQRQAISKQYLEQIVSLLNTSNILRASRGKQGGYMLANEPGEYTVAQILRITEGNLVCVTCLENEPNQCSRAPYCKTLPMWTGLSKVINEYLESITLQDLCRHTPQSPDSYEI